MFGRWLYLWCVLVCVILVIPMLHLVHLESGILYSFDSSRWVHFLIYAVAVAVPVGVWHRGLPIYLTLASILLSIAMDSLASDPLLRAVRSQMIPAELFGAGAGILLGLNLRIMHKAQDPLNAGNQKASNRAAL